MNIIIYLTNGKRIYINNVAEILMCQADGTTEAYISIVYLNLNTCYYDTKNWKASEVKNITCRDFDT